VKKIMVSSLSAALLLSGCASSLSNNDIKGIATGVGAVGGALLGGKMGKAGGAAIGALAGGLIGKLIADEIIKRREALKKIAKEEKMQIRAMDISDSDLKGRKTTMTKSRKSDASGGRRVGDRVVIEVAEQFEPDSKELTPEAKKAYEKIAKLYAGTKGKILVVGHTDDTGSSTYNQKLSEERARAVGMLLKEAGVPEERIFYLGAGEAMPIADNHLAEGRQRNRRVEIVELSDERQILQYVENRRANPAFFRTETRSPEKTGIARASGSKKQGNFQSKNRSKKVARRVETEEKKHAKNPITNDKVHASVDFHGTPVADSRFHLKEKFGEPVENLSFSFLTQAHASNDNLAVYNNCLHDRPHVVGDIKSIKSGKALRTSDFKKGLNETVWTADVDGHLLGITHVGVLNTGEVTAEPIVYIYKNYVPGSRQKPDATLHATANAYQGTKGLLYRLFSKEKGAIQCIDIVFDDKNVNHSEGILYFYKNGRPYERRVTLKELGR